MSTPAPTQRIADSALAAGSLASPPEQTDRLRRIARRRSVECELVWRAVSAGSHAAAFELRLCGSSTTDAEGGTLEDAEPRLTLELLAIAARLVHVAGRERHPAATCRSAIRVLKSHDEHRLALVLRMRCDRCPAGGGTTTLTMAAAMLAELSALGIRGVSAMKQANESQADDKVAASSRAGTERNRDASF